MANANKRIARIIGVGQELGALARRFTAACRAAALAARTEANMAEAAATIDAVAPSAAGGANEAAACDLIGGVGAEQEPLGMATHDTRGWVRKSIQDVGAAELEDARQRSSPGAVILGPGAARRIVSCRSRRIPFTGGAAGGAGFSASAGFSAAKGGLGACVQSPARELNPQGVHAAHFGFDGPISGSGDVSGLCPDAIAETHFHVHTQQYTPWYRELEPHLRTEKF